MFTCVLACSIPIFFWRYIFAFQTSNSLAHPFHLRYEFVFSVYASVSLLLCLVFCLHIWIIMYAAKFCHINETRQDYHHNECIIYTLRICCIIHIIFLFLLHVYLKVLPLYSHRVNSIAIFSRKKSATIQWHSCVNLQFIFFDVYKIRWSVWKMFYQKYLFHSRYSNFSTSTWLYSVLLANKYLFAKCICGFQCTFFGIDYNQKGVFFFSFSISFMSHPTETG